MWIPLSLSRCFQGFCLPTREKETDLSATMGDFTSLSLCCPQCNPLVFRRGPQYSGLKSGHRKASERRSRPSPAGPACSVTVLTIIAHRKCSTLAFSHEGCDELSLSVHPRSNLRPPVSYMSLLMTKPPNRTRCPPVLASPSSELLLHRPLPPTLPGCRFSPCHVELLPP